MPRLAIGLFFRRDGAEAARRAQDKRRGGGADAMRGRRDAAPSSERAASEVHGDKLASATRNVTGKR